VKFHYQLLFSDQPASFHRHHVNGGGGCLRPPYQMKMHKMFRIGLVLARLAISAGAAEG
jgi:hypothetical protein